MTDATQKHHAISATVDGVPQRWEYDSIDELMPRWQLFAQGRVVPGTSKPALDLVLTIAGKECVRLWNDGWEYPRKKDKAA